MKKNQSSSSGADPFAMFAALRQISWTPEQKVVLTEIVQDMEVMRTATEKEHGVTPEILVHSPGENRRFWRKAKPQIESAVTQTMRRIEALMTDEQKTQYQEITGKPRHVKPFKLI